MIQQETLMRILAIISGEYGRRHVDNIRAHGPPHWEIEVWQAPAVLPPMIDYPEDYIPEKMAEAALILSFAENRGVAELIPEIANLTGAQAVIAAVDNEAWLPRGLARQLRGWLEDMNVACVTPKPLCSLTENSYGVARRKEIAYEEPLIAKFAKHFGQPDLEIGVDPTTRVIISAEVQRDAVCGCARYVAEKLIGIPVDEAEEKAGLLHHHYPCMASMTKDIDFGDTLMHISGNVMKENVGSQIKPFKSVQYIRPGQGPSEG
jgi:hypothetical protein